LATILDCFVDDPVLDGDLVGTCFREVCHSGIVAAEVYLGEALVEKDLCRIEFELESQLFVVAINKRALATANFVPQV
jgi:hypothetical protein